ncbi:hypothetical protein HMI54_000742 [Coelomomyces lativittatus]|nr:hypothetical protein HMI55_002331 [Coelomomyces lativittatus]KAJ1511557.1 hypothetical protein HMI54_000742 [Coelomomyces lativittatus]
MKLFSDSISSAGCLKKGWLIELPVTVRAPMFVSVLAHELHWNSLHVSPQLPSTQYYEKQVLGLTDTMDTLIQEQTKYHSWQRHYAREKQRVDFLLRQKKEDLDRKSILAKLPFEPNRMETLLVSQHLVQQTQQVVQGLPSSMFAIELAKQATSANI